MSTQASRPLEETTRGRTELTRNTLLEAGILLFSEQGYEATSTRQIEARAGVQRNLMTYHFGSKDEFWKACMTRLTGQMGDRLGPAVLQSNDIELRERIRFLIKQFVRTSASMPEFARIMFDEGRSNGWRLEWLVANNKTRFFERLKTLFDDGRKADFIPDMPFVNFYYTLVGSAAIFSMSAECELLTGKTPLNDKIVDAHAETIANLLTKKT
ncbi:MAG: TetR/AcrR family transcriptional regulator [Pseudomonadota bacterium]